MEKRTPTSHLWKRSAVSTAVCSLFVAGASLSAFAQTDTSSLQRVEVTGSAIKRIEAETSVPVTVIRSDDLQKQGIITVEQALNLVAGNQTLQGSSQSVGLVTGGAAFANMRGLGQNKTLVLLNGRRIANSSFDGSAPDLNMIPMAALDRIEVLRDGASSLYGTDAIGGVINFITKKDMTGGSITVGADFPFHPGGAAQNANIGYGFGDLTKDRFNILAFVDYQKQDEVKASQRPFGSTGYNPSMGLSKSSGTPDPGNYYQVFSNGKASPKVNPSAPDCNAPWGFSLNGTNCRYDYSRWVDLVPPTTRLSGMVNLTYAVNNDTQLTVNYFSTTGTNKTAIAPVPYAALTMNPGTQFFPGNGVTPAPKNFAIDPTLPIAVQWRTVAAGARADESDNKQQRFLVGLDGSLAGWDYSTAVSYNSNDVTNKLTGGYSDGGLITAGVQNGVINPFGAQTAAGTAAINAALLKGTLLTGKGEVTSFDAHASRELGDWTGSGRATALAIGTEFRRETSSFKANSDFAAKVIASTGVDPATDSHGTRDVYAFNAELNVPITKQLEVTGAARYDHYSDFGSTFNPKLSFRFQPSSSLLFRGSASTGFRAPSLYDINAPQTYTNTANSWDDPVQCPDGTPVPGALPTACGQQFMSLSGGNKALKPEKSKNFTLGTVIEPVKDLSVGVDFWWIKLTDQIGSLSDVTIFSNTTKYAYLFKRAPNGSLSIDGSQCPGAQCGYVLDTTMNLGGVHTNGADLSLAYRIRTASAGTFDIRYSGTYVAKYEYQNEPNGEWVQNVGVYSGAGPIFRLQHNVNLNWSKGDYSVGLTNHYKSDYIDENAGGQTNTVKSYSTWDIDGSWNITKGLTLVLGVKNLFDTNPPFSNQGNTFQTGYDPRFTDPLGRAYYLRGTYRF